MNGMATNTKIGLFLAAFLLTTQFAVAGPDVEVTAADPSAAPPGTVRLDVTISGNGFDGSAKVRFLKAGTEEVGDVIVNKARTINAKQIMANIDVPGSAADQQDYDIEVQMSRGRGGKGTTLFKVDSTVGRRARAECNLDFVAEFDDLAGDGLWSDGDTYTAIGGVGFRLDTNGSQSLERDTDSRHVLVDFSVDDLNGCATPEDPNDPLQALAAGEAAGFCKQSKGVDLRFDHQEQDIDTANPGGLCTMLPGETRELALHVAFEAEPDGTLDNPSSNPKKAGTESTALLLNYGCLYFTLPADDYVPEYRARVTRTTETNPDGTVKGIWYIEGYRACLHTYQGVKLEVPDAGEADGYRTIYLDMPFGLTIRDVNQP